MSLLSKKVVKPKVKKKVVKKKKPSVPKVKKVTTPKGDGKLPDWM